MRAKLPGRPTRDCLFSDPARDGKRYLYCAGLIFDNSSYTWLFIFTSKFCVSQYLLAFCSLLKIWNLNDFSGVVGVFNCQGAGWCKDGKTNRIHDKNPGTITGVVRAKDVDYLRKVADQKWTGDTILYSHLDGMFLQFEFVRYSECFKIRQKYKISFSNGVLLLISLLQGR